MAYRPMRWIEIKLKILIRCGREWNKKEDSRKKQNRIPKWKQKLRLFIDNFIDADEKIICFFLLHFIHFNSLFCENQFSIWNIFHVRTVYKLLRCQNRFHIEFSSVARKIQNEKFDAMNFWRSFHFYLSAQNNFLYFFFSRNFLFRNSIAKSDFDQIEKKHRNRKQTKWI